MTAIIKKTPNWRKETVDDWRGTRQVNRQAWFSGNPSIREFAADGWTFQDRQKGPSSWTKVIESTDDKFVVWEVWTRGPRQKYGIIEERVTTRI